MQRDKYTDQKQRKSQQNSYSQYKRPSEPPPSEIAWEFILLRIKEKSQHYLHQEMTRVGIVLRNLLD